MQKKARNKTQQKFTTAKENNNNKKKKMQLKEEIKNSKNLQQKTTLIKKNATKILKNEVISKQLDKKSTVHKQADICTTNKNTNVSMYYMCLCVYMYI